MLRHCSKTKQFVTWMPAARERSNDVNILEGDSGADGSGCDEEANNEADVPIHDDAFMSVEMDMMFAMLDCFSEDAVQRV